MTEGYLAFLLHAHLPYINHPQYKKFFEEDWFFEAMAEVYIPLFSTLYKLYEKGYKFQLTISISPTLLGMLKNDVLIAKFENYLFSRIEFLNEELSRYRPHETELIYLAKFYKNYYETIKTSFTNELQRNILAIIKELERKKLIELITTSATHTFLPNFLPAPEYIKLQQTVGLTEFSENFGTNTLGFWLPECGYFPGLEENLADNGVKYTILEFHGLMLADPIPIYGTYAPIYNHNDFIFFGRDIESAKQIWSREIGYPANSVYRDFYKDVGFEWDILYTKNLLHQDLNGNFQKTFTGIKYWAIGDKNSPTKPFYNPVKAKKQAEIDARDFINKKSEKAKSLFNKMDKPPIFVAPFDMELFGHWWFEGIWFLESLIKKVQNSNLELISFSEYLKRHTKHQVANPVYSSWGENGFSQVWNNEKTNYFIKESLSKCFDLKDNIQEILNFSKKGIEERKIILSLIKELMLLTASDWPFLVYSNIETYAYNRFNQHKTNFEKLLDFIKTNNVDKNLLNEIEYTNKYLFNSLNIELLESAYAGNQ